MTLRIKPNKRVLLIVVGVFIGISMSVGYAAFIDKGKILGSTFSVGSSDLKLLKDLSLGGAGANLADEIQGPTFTNISSNWTKDYMIKLYNNATDTLALTTNAYYETANDPDDLRSVIFVEPFVWNDNGNGTLDAGELGTSFGKKTVIKWKTEGFNLGQLEKAGTKGLVLRFSTDAVSDTKQGKSGSFDFEFGAATLN